MTQQAAALAKITADLRATYEALAAGNVPVISIGQWQRLAAAEQLTKGTGR